MKKRSATHYELPTAGLVGVAGTILPVLRCEPERSKKAGNARSKAVYGAFPFQFISPEKREIPKIR